MKLKEIASSYKIDREELTAYLESPENTTIHYSKGMLDWSVDDNYVSTLVTRVTEKIAGKQREAEEEVQKQKMKKQAMAQMLITSGFNFDGYTITKYSGYISGDDAVSVERGTAFWNAPDVKDKLMESLVVIRRNALNELKEAAYALGCNAVIGVDFDYLTLDPQTANFNGGTVYQPYVFGVTANGNAVVIEKNKS